MSTVVTWQTSTTSSEDTEQLAEKLGKSLRGGEVVELVSDLGGGKTTFVRGLARGMGSQDRVASPTFTISRVYEAAENREMHHFDFYRLGEAGLIAEELEDILNDPSIVIVVEWANVVHDVLPDDRLTITIEQTGSDKRNVTFSAPESLEYLIEAVK
jgi:tRNA threonylcarbamoyladenosine biosynthesis protein TsaE